MAQIVQQGALNTTALVVPDLYVQIVPPAQLSLNGVPTNVLGVVGTAAWGAVNQPVIIASMANYAAAFGALIARKYDMGTHVATAVQQGAQNFRCVRVTDGTDAAASGSLGTNWLTLTSLYTGSAANGDTATWQTGSKAGTSRLVLTRPGLQPEVYDNLAGTGNALAVAAAAAVNSGTNVLRGASQLMIATAGAGTVAPTVGTAGALSGGLDGATPGIGHVTAATLVGVDGLPRTGMYALRGQGCSVALLADADDSTQWTTQAGFGLSEGVYIIGCGPSGDTITNAISTKATAGLDFYSFKLMFGDWIYWNDQVNGTLRLVSPQGFIAGRLANLSPERSSLNKSMFSVVGSQKSGVPGSAASAVYSAAELQALFQVGIDVIANPQPGGAYWGARLGHNSSSDATRNGDNYTRMTNYIASTIAAGMGGYVGRVVNTTLFQNIRSTLLAFLQNMLGQGLLGTTDGTLPFAVVCDITNNPQARTSLGYVQADCQIQYQAINEKFIVNLQGGQTVVVVQSTAQSFTSAAA